MFGTILNKVLKGSVSRGSKMVSQGKTYIIFDFSFRYNMHLMCDKTNGLLKQDCPFYRCIPGKLLKDTVKRSEGSVRTLIETPPSERRHHNLYRMKR